MDHSSSSFANLPPQDLAGEAVHLVSVSDTVPQPYHHNHNHVSSTTPKPDPDPTLAGEDAHSLQPLQSAVGDLTAYTHDHSNGIMGVPDAYHSLLSNELSHLLPQHPSSNSSHSSIFSSKENGYLRDQPSILDPPDLELWRNRLFNVDETLVLSEAQFRTYFPHVDNIYSHRSTQQYKRKPLISHYWDCRLKGRPPGTPKSNDPNKKKRKRTARARDLCDVKIKITEFLPGAATVGAPDADTADAAAALLRNSSSSSSSLDAQQQQFGVLAPNSLPEGHPGAQGQRFFTIQRVNGNGANGKNDGVGGGHRHSLEESDRVKKSSVQRYLLREMKGRRKNFSTNTMSQKNYHTKATGQAAETVTNHTTDQDLKLYGSCFCPFVQRVWIALEAKGIPYQYIEVDPYKKPPSLLEVNPRGLVPALRHGDWGSYESTVLLEYLEDLNVGPSLLPAGDAKRRAHCRLWTDFVNRNIVPTFYRVLQEQNEEKQIAHAQELRDAFTTLIDAADPHGPLFLGPDLSFVDVQVAPWIIRLRRVLKPYRGWPDPEQGSRWAAWVDALESNEHVKATTSGDELYLDSYERYAQNRPNTSQVANAINSGRGLP
ncbi:glutathione S-transferase family protein [Aspergillus candidus]|uniref:Glutathione S-transferase n=1 Tax=Aspergillus candidus TaxID=41067 RepID=A0A2I2FPA0_ASPCN|nr:glutathione S-transferase [Aspergillus candidus]PLB42459.1 glutathione S-transferase [Aspergillus candidus]